MRASTPLLFAVPLVGLLELMAHEYFARRAPSLQQWANVREPVRQLQQPGDPVVVAPYWAEPLARHVLGSMVMPLREVARPDLTGYRRAVEVSLLGEQPAELEGWRVVEERRVADKFLVRLRENPAPADVRFDFVDALGPAEVTVTAATRACPWREHARRMTGGLHGPMAFPEQRFQCPGGGPYFVGVTVVDDEQYRPRRCIWAHPVRGGTLTIRYRGVPLGRVIRGHGGLSWFLMRDGMGSPIELTVRIDGEMVGAYVHRDEQGWNRFELPTGRHEGTSAEVEFEISSQDPRNRNFCFHADTR